MALIIDKQGVPGVGWAFVLERFFMGYQQKPGLFIGPKAEQAEAFAGLWRHLLEITIQRRQTRFAVDPEWAPVPVDAELGSAAAVQDALDSLLALLSEEIPTFSPRYLGHMVSDVSVPALLGHMAMLFENANLASREAAIVASSLETEAINLLATMVGFDPHPARGHFTSGGTLANFEAVWRARYRLDHWLALGVCLKLRGHSEAPLFSWAHCGWPVYHREVARHGLNEKDLMEYSGVLRGSLAMSRLVAEQLQEEWPEPVFLVPGNKHYSWPKAANIFGFGREAVWGCELDEGGRLSPEGLLSRVNEAEAAGRPVLMIVSVAGTTELGMIDPVDGVVSLLGRLANERGVHVWHHVDAAYGGYLCSTLRGQGGSELSPSVQRALGAIPQANSVTLDPHKLGFVPYACGAIIVPDAVSYAVSSIHAPYLEETAEAKFPSWSTTLEGSRAATGPSAVWLSARVMPLDAGGHGRLLNQSLQVTRRLYGVIAAVAEDIRMLEPSDSNVICFAVASFGDSLSSANQKTECVIRAFRESAELSATRTQLGCENYGDLICQLVNTWRGDVDAEQLTVVRMVIMNPYLEADYLVEGISKYLTDTLQTALDALPA